MQVLVMLGNGRIALKTRVSESHRAEQGESNPSDQWFIRLCVPTVVTVLCVPTCSSAFSLKHETVSSKAYSLACFRHSSSSQFCTKVMTETSASHVGELILSLLLYCQVQSPRQPEAAVPRGGNGRTRSQAHCPGEDALVL